MVLSPSDLLCVKGKQKGYNFATNKKCLQKWQATDQLEHTKMIQQVQQSSYSREILQASATEDSLNDTGKIPHWLLTWQWVWSWNYEQDTMAWPLRKKKLCFATKQCSVLFSILCLTVPNHGYLRYISENICVNELQKKTQLKMIEYPELEGWPTRIIRVQVLALHQKTPKNHSMCLREQSIQRAG